MSSFLDNLFTTGTASALATPTGSIAVNTTTPVMNYVLKVVSLSPLRAGWVPEAGAGGAGAPVYTPHVVTAGTLAAAVDNAYLMLAACTVTLPDATDPANVGRSIVLMFNTGPNQVNTASLETANLLIDLGFTATEMAYAGGGLLLTSVYDPDNYPGGFWLAQRYQPKAFSSTLPLHASQIHSVYPAAALPAPYDTATVDGVTTISGSGLTVGSLERDMEGAYSAGDLVLFMFLSDVPGLYRCVTDAGGTDWSFEFVEGPDSDPDPNGDPSYYVKNGETWGGRTVRCHQLSDPFYTFERAALDYYPRNGDVLATGVNTGQVHDNTNQLLPGRVNLVEANATHHAFTLAAPDANQERIFGERFAVKSIQYDATATFSVDVTPATIEDLNGDFASSVSFTIHKGTYAEWQLMSDGIWHLVAWLEGSEPA